MLPSSTLNRTSQDVVRDNKYITIVALKTVSTSIAIVLQLVILKALLQALNYNISEACTLACLVFIRLQAGTE